MMAREAIAPSASVLQARPSGRTLVTKSAGNAVLNGATVVLNFVIALVLSHLIGADGYGAYAFGIAVAALLTVPALLGLPSLVVREIAASRVRRSWGAIRGLVRRANQAVSVASVLVCGGAALVFVLTGWPPPPLRDPTFLALPLVVLVALVSVRQCAMQGLGHVVSGRTPEAVVSPALAIVLIVVLDAALGERFSASWAVVGLVLAGAVALVLGVILLRRALFSEIRATQPSYATRTWAIAAGPLIQMSAISALNDQAGTVLLGALSDAQDVGIFSVVLRVSALIPFLLLATVPTLMPSFAELHAHRADDELQRLSSRAARLILYGSLPIVAGVLVLAEPVLRVFGSGFSGGATPLRILAVGQLVNIATGLPGTILIMVDEAGRVTRSVVVGAIANVALSIALIPPYGASGAAVATATSVALTNVLLAGALWRTRRIWSPPFGRPR
jgi:O-antigen/teichoic acid export membrane protein